ncbi:hypothetical protein B5E84_01100 [Lachnoclostridium sp. An14]|nr:hypothetical protein B5E84_01100 [Lachnoclostridium sp. An14]
MRFILNQNFTNEQFPFIMMVAIIVEGFCFLLGVWRKGGRKISKTRKSKEDENQQNQIRKGETT